MPTLRYLTPHPNDNRLRRQESSMGSSNWVDWVAGILCIGFWIGFGFYVLCCAWLSAEIYLTRIQADIGVFPGNRGLRCRLHRPHPPGHTPLGGYPDYPLWK